MNSPRWEERRRAIAGIRLERESVPLLPFPCRGESLKNSKWAKRMVSLDAASETSGQTLGDTLPAGMATPHEATESAERAKAVCAAVQALPDDLREAIVLCEWGDLSMALLPSSRPRPRSSSPDSTGPGNPRFCRRADTAFDSGASHSV